MYSNSFTGPAGADVSESSWFTTLTNFYHYTNSIVLDGTGKAYFKRGASANYRVRVTNGTSSPQTEYPDMTALKISAVVRTPVANYIAIGFGGNNNGVVTGGSSGPYIYLAPGFAQFFGGVLDQNAGEKFTGVYAAGDVIRVELTYNFAAGAALAVVNGTTVHSGTFTHTKDDAPAAVTLSHAQVHFNNQDTNAATSAYLDELIIETIMPEFGFMFSLQTFDMVKFINAELAAGNTNIVIPPGRYYVSPKSRQHLLLQNLTNITIDATGVEMVCTETTRAITVQNCTNVTIRGMTIDYDPLPFTQGRVTAVSGDGMELDVELFDGFPAADKAVPGPCEIFKADGAELRYGEYHLVAPEMIHARKLKVIKDSSQRNKLGGEQIGDILVLKAEHAPGGSIPHAVYASRSQNVRFENITLYAANSFGFFESDCDNTTYLRCVIDRRPLESDPVRREHFRVRSLNADGYHSTSAVRGAQLLESSAYFQGDDAVNFSGLYHLIAGATNNTLTVIARRSMDIQAGDWLEIINKNGVPFNDAQVVSIQADGTVNAEELAWIETQAGVLKQVRELLTSKYTIVLADAPEWISGGQNMAIGGAVGARDRMGNGFKIANCRFGYNRSRGILVRAAGEIYSNVIERSGMDAILVESSYAWLESGFVRGLDIAGNQVINSGGPAINVIGMENKTGIGHREITIQNNQLTTANSPAVSIQCADGVLLENNLLNGAPVISGMQGVIIKNCNNVIIR
ncbi:MAG: hypothetical protein WC959_03440 [Kiritimatiellales bacterium]